MPPPDDINDLRQKLTHADAVIVCSCMGVIVETSMDGTSRGGLGATGHPGQITTAVRRERNGDRRAKHVDGVRMVHVSQYFVKAEPTDPRPVEALAFARTLYTFQREIQDGLVKPGSTITDADVVQVRRTPAGPILTQFADWLGGHTRSATPKSLFGQGVEYNRNQWASLVWYLDDARFAIDNGARRTRHPATRRRPRQLAARRRRRRA